MRHARRRKARAHAGREVDLALIGDERRRAFQYIDELVLLAVPVQQRRLAAGPQAREIHAEILEAEEVAQRPLLALRHAAEERLRIVGGLRPKRSCVGFDRKRRVRFGVGILGAPLEFRSRCQSECNYSAACRLLFLAVPSDSLF